MALRDRIRAGLATGMLLVDLYMPSSATASPPPVSAGDQPQAVASGTRPRKKTKSRPRTSPLPVNQTRWLQSDIEAAALRAASGDLTLVAQLYRAFQRDGSLQGLLGTRTGGLVRLPKRFLGTPCGVAVVEGSEGQPGCFDAYFPQAELERFDADGIVVGVAVGEFVQGDEDAHPVFVRLDPEFLIYRWSEDRWYYRSLDGLLPITPGDGRWVLHTPRGRYEPWNHGLWQALARAFVSKEHSLMYRENYAGKLANPARVAVSPQGASEMQKQSWFRSVMAWGVNTVFGLTPGYDVKLLESNGRGYEVFKDIIETSDHEYMISIAGQIVTVTGGSGFANANIHATIRSDLIQGDGNALASTLNDQALPPVVFDVTCGDMNARVWLAWDTRPPADLASGAASLSAAATAINDVTAALTPHGLKADVPAIAARFAVPVLGDRNGDAVPDDPALAPAQDAPQLSETNDTNDTNEDAQPDAAAALAAKMTEHGVARCEHGSSNRCRLCGVERTRDFDPGVDGADHSWRVAWQPIARAGAT